MSLLQDAADPADPETLAQSVLAGVQLFLHALAPLSLPNPLTDPAPGGSPFAAPCFCRCCTERALAPLSSLFARTQPETLQAMADSVVFSGEVAFSKHERCRLKATSEELILIPQIPNAKSSHAHILHIADIFAVIPEDLGTRKSFHVHFLKEGKNFKRTHEHEIFTCKTAEDRDQWVTVLRSVLAGVSVGDPIPRRKILVLINPFGGKKKAPTIYDRIVAPIFRLAGVDVEMMHTQRAGHATEIGKTFDTKKYDGICTLSGDGLLHELLQGIMQRPDWQEALKVPMGIIPGGSGNGLARSLHTPTPLAAVLNIVKGKTRSVDLCSAVQAGAPVRYAFLAYFWGLVADIDIESEKYRWAGPARFTMTGVARILNLRKYHGRLTYLPWDESELITKREGAEDGSGPLRLYSEATIEQNRDKWVTVEDDFILVMAVNVPWVAIDVFFGPFSNINDGAIDLTYATKSTTTSKILPVFLDTTNPKFVYHPTITHVKVKAFFLEPLSPRGCMDVDGEHVPNVPIFVESIPQVATMFCPSALSLPHYPLSERPVYEHLGKGGEEALKASAGSARASAATTTGSSASARKSDGATAVQEASSASASASASVAVPVSSGKQESKDAAQEEDDHHDAHKVQQLASSVKIPDSESWASVV